MSTDANHQDTQSQEDGTTTTGATSQLAPELCEFLLLCDRAQASDEMAEEEQRTVEQAKAALAKAKRAVTQAASEFRDARLAHKQAINLRERAFKRAADFFTSLPQDIRDFAGSKASGS